MENKISVFIIAAMLILTGCEPAAEETPDFVTMGYRPHYGTAQASEIKLVSARDVKSPGKIYTYGKYLLVNEMKQGIHVFNNENPVSPKPVAFIQMLGNTDMTIRDGKLYADHNGNVVCLTFNNFTALELKQSLKLQDWDKGLPPPSNAYFECIDPSKGLVVSWEQVQLTNPDCHAIY
jgi:hypothetical protein